MNGALSKSESQLQAVTSLQQELASVMKAAERAQGIVYFVIFILKLIVCWHSRGTPMDFKEHNVTKLSEENLEEYRQLYVT